MNVYKLPWRATAGWLAVWVLGKTSDKARSIPKLYILAVDELQSGLRNMIFRAEKLSDRNVRDRPG